MTIDEAEHLFWEIHRYVVPTGHHVDPQGWPLVRENAIRAMGRILLHWLEEKRCPPHLRSACGLDSKGS